MNTPPKLTPEQIDTAYRDLPPPVQHWQLARAIETARDQQWLDMLAAAPGVERIMELAGEYAIAFAQPRAPTGGLQTVRQALRTAVEQALAKEGGRVVVTWNFDRTKILAVTRQDDEHRILKVLAEAPAAPLTKEQDDLLNTLNELTAQRDQLRKALAAMVQCSKTMNMVQCAEASQAAEAALREIPAPTEQALAARVPENGVDVHMCREVGGLTFGKKLDCQHCAAPQPPQQPAEWVGLTDAEITALKHLPDTNRQRTAVEMAYAVQAKLREKNGGGK
jgi:hypothetical protein